MVFLIRDGFSGVMQAFPLTSEDHHLVKECLLKFVGAHKGKVQTICKSDCAKELLRAIGNLDGCQTCLLPGRWHHNSVLGRQLRTFEEACRSLHLQAVLHSSRPYGLTLVSMLPLI